MKSRRLFCFCFPFRFYYCINSIQIIFRTENVNMNPKVETKKKNKKHARYATIQCNPIESEFGIQHSTFNIITYSFNFQLKLV